MKYEIRIGGYVGLVTWTRTVEAPTPQDALVKACCEQLAMCKLPATADQFKVEPQATKKGQPEGVTLFDLFAGWAHGERLRWQPAFVTLLP